MAKEVKNQLFDICSLAFEKDIEKIEKPHKMELTERILFSFLKGNFSKVCY